MSYLRLIGLLSSVAMLLFVGWKYSRRSLRRIDVLIGGAIASALAAVSVSPRLVNGLTAFLQVQTRVMALAIVADIVLFGLVLYTLKEMSEVRSSVGDLVRGLARAEYTRSQGEPGPAGLAVVIPAFDEEKALQRLLPELPVEVCGLPVRTIVIVDGARDQSAEVARKCSVPVTSHVINRGQGDALRTGFELALQGGADVVVTMDADGQHRPDQIERLVAPIVADEADFVLGTRFSGSYADRGGARHVGIVGFSALISLLIGTRISDCTNGFRAVRGSELERLTLRENRFSAPELIIEAANKRLRIREVPVTIESRWEGESKKPRSFRYPFGFARVMLKTWLRS